MTALWTAYLNLSQRVRATFVRGSAATPLPPAPPQATAQQDGDAAAPRGEIAEV